MLKEMTLNMKEKHHFFSYKRDLKTKEDLKVERGLFGKRKEIC
jgi:hypothetical protein